MRRFLNFFVGAYCGLIVGAVAALLLAPMTGRELQSQSRMRAEVIAAEVRKAYEDKERELKDYLESLKAPRLAP